ncbi:DNA repair protein RecO [Fictibacillus aquaticus]|uniref:DNA repair protein RecO n=1 Tax=Fictibacillus aquaticus TaxID=2021314 RepID=A0A235F9K2_9BACL|nr:DNA repair protein RecO [Fictibacillus aquaticus]OYD57948.1 DNA repair protein RecO [Fictibacillus aquaticus]
MIIKAEGIVIKTVPYGESNVIVTLFTREAGKIGVMARGAKKTKSRLSSVVQLFTYGMYVFQKGSGLGTLNQGEVLESFRSIREDLIKTSYSAYISELLDKVAEGNKKNPYLFEHFYQSLRFIDEGTDPEIITLLFEMKMLMIGGVKPQVSQCVQCGTQEGDFVFSVREGGFLCSRCMHQDPYHLKLSAGAVKILYLFSNLDISRLGNVSVKKETKKELRAVMDAYMEEYLGVFLKSKKFLNQLNQFEL